MRILFLFLLFTSQFFAQTLELQSQKSIELVPYYSYHILEDESHTPFEIDSKPWVSSLKELPKEGVKTGYWIHFKIVNKNSKTLNLYLLSAQSFIYAIDYYAIKEKRIITHYSESYFKRNNTPKIKGVTQRNFPLELQGDDTVDIYLKVKSFNRINTCFTLYTHDEFIAHTTIYNLLQGLFIGILLIMIVYNLILYFMLRFEPYLYYSSYVFAFLLFTSLYMGYAHTYTSMPTIYIYMLMHFSVAIFLILVTEFIRRTFHLNKFFKKLHTTLTFIQLFILLSHLLRMVVLYLDLFEYTELFSTLFYLSLPFLYLIIFYQLFYIAFFKKVKGAHLYGVLWTLLGGIGFLHVLANSNILPIRAEYDYLFELGMLVESVAFSLLLGQRLQEINQEKEESRHLLIHQSKLASMGEMISLIAHQWRQPLSELNGIALSMEVDFKKERLNYDKLNKHLNSIEHVTTYLSKTMDDFIHLSNPQKDLESFTLFEVLDKSQKLAKSAIVSNFQLHTIYTFNAKETKLVGYKSELVQVLLILFNNAIDAAQKKGVIPQITLSISMEDEYIVISVEDNGGGVDEEILQDLYNPYFTTKHKSQGTGLGLYILKMIIDNSMKGSVDVYNGEEGAIFKLKIPLNLKKFL